MHDEPNSIEWSLHSIAASLAKIAYPDQWMVPPPPPDWRAIQRCLDLMTEALVKMAYPEGKMVEEFMKREPEVQYVIEPVVLNYVTYWTVIKVVDGVAKSGDHCWDKKTQAQEAKARYELGLAKHGAPSSKVLPFP